MNCVLISLEACISISSIDSISLHKYFIILKCKWRISNKCTDEFVIILQFWYGTFLFAEILYPFFQEVVKNGMWWMYWSRQGYWEKETGVILFNGCLLLPSRLCNSYPQLHSQRTLVGRLVQTSCASEKWGAWEKVLLMS